MLLMVLREMLQNGGEITGGAGQIVTPFYGGTMKRLGIINIFSRANQEWIPMRVVGFKRIGVFEED